MQGLVVASSSPPAGGQGNVIGLKRQPDLEGDDGLSVETAIVQLKRFVAGFRKRWKFVLAIVAASLLIGILLTLRAAPVYQATGSLKIEGESTDVLNVQGADPNAYVDEARSVNTQIELIESRSFAEFVVKKLNLAADNDFFEKMKIDATEFGGSAQQVRARREAAAAAVLQGSVSARAKKETRILFVDFEAPDAGIAAKVTNAYLEGAIATDEQTGVWHDKVCAGFSREPARPGQGQTRSVRARYDRLCAGGQSGRYQLGAQQGRRSVGTFAWHCKPDRPQQGLFGRDAQSESSWRRNGGRHRPFPQRRSRRFSKIRPCRA